MYLCTWVPNGGWFEAGPLSCPLWRALFPSASCKKWPRLTKRRTFSCIFCISPRGLWNKESLFYPTGIGRVRWWLQCQNQLFWAHSTLSFRIACSPVSNPDELSHVSVCKLKSSLFVSCRGGLSFNSIFCIWSSCRVPLQKTTPESVYTNLHSHRPSKF